ncbi:MAG: hypothetical protein PVI35_00090 [Acidimicrobiia bacterium]|jgi:hypothetical protein
MANAPRSDRIHAALMLTVAGATIAYWVEHFTKGRLQTEDDDPAYLAFENAFPAADAYMAACFIASALLLRKQNAAAVPLGIAAGSAMVFLGAMDTLYNLQHGKYRKMDSAMAAETIINVVSFTFGPATMVRLWRARRRLAG